MIIHAVRLKNIKSYGIGCGDGITIKFQPGINHITGSNGCGKSTIIEAIGYALFKARPHCVESFELPTYLLRAGSKNGEIDVTFSHNNESYRIECGLGTANKRRNKVILLNDNSICAENDQEVSNFLCTLLGFNKISHLSNMFIKLIGIRQGNLNRPFDSKPSQAKEFFEPILEVEIFRQSYDQIKLALDQFELRIYEQNCLLAIEEERLKERKNSATMLAIKKEAVAKLEQQLSEATKTLTLLRNEKEQLEVKSNIIADIMQKRSNALHSLKIQEQKRVYAYNQSISTKEAAQSLGKLKKHYVAYMEAESRLAELKTSQDKQRNLETQKADIISQKANLEIKLQSVLSKLELFDIQVKTKKAELSKLKQNHTQLVNNLKQNKDYFQVCQSALHEVEQAVAFINLFFNELPNTINSQQILLKQIADINNKCVCNPDDITAAYESECEAKQQLQILNNQLIILIERRQNLETQLKEIGSGLCPFFKEKCQQFNKNKIASDLDDLINKIAVTSQTLQLLSEKLDAIKINRINLDNYAITIEKNNRRLEELKSEFKRSIVNLLPDIVLQHIEKIKRHVKFIQPLLLPEPLVPIDITCWSQGITDFHKLISNWWKEANDVITASLKGKNEFVKNRIKDEHNASHQAVILNKLENEISSLLIDKQAESKLILAINIDIQKINNKLTICVSELAKFNSIENDIAVQNEIIATNRIEYLDYIKIQPNANQALYWASELKACIDMEQVESDILANLTKILDTTKKEFDSTRLDSLTTAFLDTSSEVAVRLNDLKYAKSSLRQEEIRFNEFKKSYENKKIILEQTNHIKANINLGELARSVLKQSAPLIAQHLCNIIAMRAQEIFNLINYDPIELKWNAMRYSLRIAPGERRFAMLSGGEQTKLALAMTLAMLKELSNLKFCIFDEPTYGIDINSRNKLADAISTAQKAAQMDQILLVSHDNTFDNQVEHSILLNKVAKYGTEVTTCT